MSSTPFRPLPERPDLEQQRKLAKELHRAFAAGDPDALARIRAVLPDKPRITLTDAQHALAREYGFTNWKALADFVIAQIPDEQGIEDQLREAFHRADAAELRRLIRRHPHLRRRIDEPVFAFDSPAIVAFASNLPMVEVLLELGADPNKKSDWWAGGFHALYSATPETAERLIAAGAVPDACAAAHLDRLDLLSRLIVEDPRRVHERGGDGQTPLHFARSREAIDLLLAAGADIDARDVDHRGTAAEWMLDHGKGAGRYSLAAYLVERGATADIFLAAALGLTSAVREMLRSDPSLLALRIGQGEYGEKPPSSYHIYYWTIGAGMSPVDVARQFEQRETLEAMLEFASPAQRLIHAANSGDAASARELVRRDPDLIASLTPQEHSALAVAVWNGNESAVELMVELGFDPAATGEDSGTALHLAAWVGSVRSVSAILRHPAASELFTVRDATHGGTPLGWCCHGSLHCHRPGNYAEVARLLVRAGSPVPESFEASAAVRVAIAESVSAVG